MRQRAPLKSSHNTINLLAHVHFEGLSVSMQTKFGWIRDQEALAASVVLKAAFVPGGGCVEIKTSGGSQFIILPTKRSSSFYL